MDSLLISIKNLIPYLILISLYFLFVNIEARNDLNTFPIKKIEKNIRKNSSNLENKNIRISIPVIPYNN